MNQQNEKELSELLKHNLPSASNTELPHDLWPEMLARMNREPDPIRVPWFDWALVALAGAALLFFPGAIPALLYHL